MRAFRASALVTRSLAALLCGAPVLLVAAGAAAQPTVSAPQESAPADHKISLDLKGVDILDVLKLLSQKSGMNFVAGHNVTGRVTIFAKDVDIWQAFEQIVSANELAYEQQGDLINVMTSRDYELLYGERFQERLQQKVVSLKFAKANQVATALNQLKSNLGRVVVDEATNTVVLNDSPARLAQMEALLKQLDRQTETRIYSLNYADVEKLKDKFQDLLTPGVGTFSVDARTSKVVVTDLSSVMPKIDQVMRALDERDQDVLIEARIVEADLTNDFSLGIDWERVLSGIDAQTRSRFRVLSGDVLSGGATGAAFKLMSVAHGNSDVILEALKTYTNVETISNPRIMASNNQEAKILVGSKEAFITVTTTVPATGSTVAAPQVQFVDVGTKLFVTPTIKRDGYIQLKVRPEVSTAKPQTFETSKDVKSTVPIVTTTEAETNVLIKSGSTLIIGGLIKTKTDHTQNQVPVLGDIPVVGAAFRGVINKKGKTELVVFLTPQIVNPAGEHVTQFPSGVSIYAVQEPEALQGGSVPESYHATLRDYLTKTLAQQLQSAGLGAGTVEISFVLARDGHIAEAPVISSPQGEPFIHAARVALNAASPFPPFPAEATARQARFHVRVDFQPVSSGS